MPQQPRAGLIWPHWALQHHKGSLEELLSPSSSRGHSGQRPALPAAAVEGSHLHSPYPSDMGDSRNKWGSVTCSR